MVYFREIRKTRHYIENHEHEVPWEKVVELLLATKSPRKKGYAFEIEDGNYYLLFKIEKGILFVINAKKQK